MFRKFRDTMKNMMNKNSTGSGHDPKIRMRVRTVYEDYENNNKCIVEDDDSTMMVYLNERQK